MSDAEIGKRMFEQMVLDQLLDSFPTITGRQLTDEMDGNHLATDPNSPDFIIGLDGRVFGIELAEIHGATDVWDYHAEASRLAWQKHESYQRRGLFRFPIALVFHSTEPPLFDIKGPLTRLDGFEEFEAVGFTELWAVDFSDAYYSPQDPRRPADMFCFKPQEWHGFHRIGRRDRKPFG